MNVDKQHAQALSREDVQWSCRPLFWTLPASELSLIERLELMNRVAGYLECVDPDWLNQAELEGLLHLHGLLVKWLEKDDASLDDPTDAWARLATELDIDATVAGPPIDVNEKASLDVVDGELLLPNGEDEATVIVRVRTQADRVLEFDMALRWGAIVDATDDYDEVDGELVKHVVDMSRSEEVDRYLGRRERE
jgi:hypothetical protein